MCWRCFGSDFVSVGIGQVGPGLVRLGLAWHGMVWRGAAGLGKTWAVISVLHIFGCAVRCGQHHPARLRAARHGLAGRGNAGLGAAGQDMDAKAWTDGPKSSPIAMGLRLGLLGRDRVRRSMARYGSAGLGTTWRLIPGVTGLTSAHCNGLFRLGLARRGSARRGADWHGPVRQDKAGNPATGGRNPLS